MTDRVKMTDRMDRPDDGKQGGDFRKSKQVKDKKALDTFFPSRGLMVLMVGIFIIFNIIVGMKVFSLQKEKAVIEILKARYESYAKIIRDVEDKEEKLRRLTQEIVPLEKRAENAQKKVAVSNDRVKKNRDELNKIRASNAEISETLNASRTTISELINEKKTLRKEKQNLEKLVSELNVDEKKAEQKILEKKQELGNIEEKIRVAKIRLKDQQKYIKNVAAANSNFDDIRKQLLKFIKKMDETQTIADERIKDLKKVITGVAEEKDQLSSQTVNLANETKMIAQSNASIKKEITGFKEQNKEYKSEIKNVTSISGQMKSIATNINETATNIKETATNIGIDEKTVNNNATAIKKSLGQMKTANSELVQTSKQFTAVVTDVTSQRENIDIFIKKIADFPDMKVQVIAFKKVLNEIEELTGKLSERVSAIQNNFNGKLDGMNLSFGSLEKDFTDLSLKIDGVKKALEKIASRAQKVLDKNQETQSPSE